MTDYFHTTDSADLILHNSFRDSEGRYGLASITLRGVFIADSPLDINEGAAGSDVLRVALPDGLDMDEWELVEKFEPYREWCVPASLLNELGELTMMTGDLVHCRCGSDRLWHVGRAILSRDRLRRCGCRLRCTGHRCPQPTPGHRATP